MFEGFKGMHIDEERAILNISDHNLVRAWFKIGHNMKPKWEKKKHKTITVMKKDESSLEKCRNHLKNQIGRSSNFNLFLKKLKTSVNHHLKKRKRIKVGKKGNKIIRAAEWMDLEIIESIKLRMKLNKIWRFSRRNQSPQIQKACKEEYENQKKVTAALIYRKKSQWEKDKIQETWKDGKLFWNMIRELLGNNKEDEEEVFIYDE